MWCISIRGFLWVLSLVCYTTGKVWFYPCRSKWVEEVIFWLDIHQMHAPYSFALFLTDNAGELAGKIAKAWHNIHHKNILAGPIRDPKARGKIEVKQKFMKQLVKRTVNTAEWVTGDYWCYFTSSAGQSMNMTPAAGASFCSDFYWYMRQPMLPMELVEAMGWTVVEDEDELKTFAEEERKQHVATLMSGETRIAVPISVVNIPGEAAEDVTEQVMTGFVERHRPVLEKLAAETKKKQKNTRSDMTHI
jgi:hypothetical protein